jgi:hypothetical protein
MPHFEFKGTDPRARAMIWEFTPSISFFSSNFGKVVPYVTAGVGGVTGYIGDIPTSDDRDFDISGVSLAFRGENDFDVKAADMLRNATPNDPGTPPQSLIMEDGDTFFAISYGGGIKAINVWGPLGFRGDVRGRSMPNFFGNSMTWLELTGGLTFNWGER